MKRALAGLVLAAMGGAAGAAIAPRAVSKGADRAVVAFDEDHDIRLCGRLGRSTRVDMGRGRSYVRHHLSFERAWLVVPMGQEVVIQMTDPNPEGKPEIKPVPFDADLTVQTSTGEVLSFDLAACARYFKRVTIQWPAKPAAIAAPVVAAPAPPPALRNIRYSAIGSRAIEPAEVSDDGRSVRFRWPAGVRRPVVYVLRDNGKPGLVRGHAEGDAFVSHELADRFVLVDGAIDDPASERLCVVRETPIVREALAPMPEPVRLERVPK